MHLRLCSLFILFFSFSTAFGYTVVIDPGHGGIDGGASRDSFKESEIVYQIAEKIESLLKQKENITVFLTRPLDQGKSLHDRVKYADEKKADLFLSLHANSSPSSQVSGMEYYFQAKTPAPVLLTRAKNLKTADNPQLTIESIKNDLTNFGKTKLSLELSQHIKDQTTIGKIRRAPFYVIENTSMPSVLVEVGFISNQREARKLISTAYQQELAHALTEAIMQFKEKSDK